MKRVSVTTRKSTASVAVFLEELELRQPKVVTSELLDEIITETGSHLSAQGTAERLVREGWLSPLRTRDAWEFVPALRAGRYPSHDPWIELRALLMRHPDAPVAVAFASAVWERGCSSHEPSYPTLAHRPGWRPPRALGNTRAVSYNWRLPTWEKDGLPVWQAATVVVAMANRPEVQDDWGNADEWLPEIMKLAAPADVLAEATGRSQSTLVRLMYLAEWSGRFDIVETLEPLIPTDLTVTYFGSRGHRGRWVNRWKIYDSILPSR